MSEGSVLVVPEGYTLHSENSAHILLPTGNQAFLNPVQEFNRDISIACIRTWGDVFNEEKHERWLKRRRKREDNEGRSAKKRKTEKTVEKEGVNVNDEGRTESVTATDADADMPVVTEEPAVAGESAEQPQDKSGAIVSVDGEGQPIAKETAKENQSKPFVHPDFKPYHFTILEALSATGLRSIRYAKEIPLVRYIIANDLSPAAVEAMRKNVEINGLGAPVPDPDIAVEPSVPPSETVHQSGSHSASSDDKGQQHERPRQTHTAHLPKVRVNAGDACALMYNHRSENGRVDVVDLDPYGTAAPFIDAAVQCVSDGGLLCVTCTDLGVLASTNYMEKCFANYGGVPVKAEYCHEVALRLVLHAISTSATRYGRYIQPLLCLSIDFYVRLFIRINTAPVEAKRAASQTATYYVCTGCQAFHAQPLGKITEKTGTKSDHVNLQYKTSGGPPIGQECDECGYRLHIAGPMWAGPLHDTTFVKRVITHLDASEGSYGTWTRMKGMLTVASEEVEAPFYFSPAKVAGFFHSTCPPLDDVLSALLNAGHAVSRSHALAGSVKTSASRAEVHDVFRTWIKTHPVKMENVKANSPTIELLKKELKAEADFTAHPATMSQSSKVKLVRYPPNPAPNWGPGTKASQSNGKRKREEN